MRIAYYTAGDRNWPSSRLRAFRPGEALAELGHEVAFNPPNADSADAIMVQKRFDLREQMAAWRAAGKRVVFDVDDWIADGPVDLADVVTTDTKAKKELYPTAKVIPDCLDIDDGAPVKIEHAQDLRRCVWFGSPDCAYHIVPAWEACRKLGIALTCITDTANPRFNGPQGPEYKAWSADTVDADIITADLVVRPYVNTHVEWVASKGPHTMLKAWGLRMPVVATPIASFVDAGLAHGATTLDEWLYALQVMRSRDAREQDAERGFRKAQAYRAENLAWVWKWVFDGS